MTENNATWIRGDDGEFQRSRNTNESVRGFPIKFRRAELVCSGRPVAVVYPRNARIGDMEVLHTDSDTPISLGSDFVVSCRCGSDHDVDGAALRSAVMGTRTPRGGRCPQVNIRDVST